MITRDKIYVSDLLYSKRLDLGPAVDQAAKIFTKWLKEHPEYSPDDVNISIKSYEQEEDHYGHFGNIIEYVRIFKKREETDLEYDARIAKEESESLDKFRNKLHPIIEGLIQDFNIYPNMVSNVITAHINNIENAVMDIVKEKLNNSNKKEGKLKE